jgi:hypothetical protein
MYVWQHTPYDTGQYTPFTQAKAGGQHWSTYEEGNHSRRRLDESRNKNCAVLNMSTTKKPVEGITSAGRDIQ